MKAKSIISDLRSKFAEKTWNETFQLVRRCMDKSRDESKPLFSMNTMKSRLEMIAKQQGMGFHITEATCYLTADLFYLEVVLLPCGGVEEVKVAPHGGAPVPSESLLQLLRSKHFAEFSAKLADLFTQYNIPGDKVPKDADPQVDMINNGRIGCLIAGKEDCPLTIQFYIRPTDGIKASDLQITDAVVQAAQVTVGVSDVTHKLQMASVIPQPAQLDPQGYPTFLPLSEVQHEALPACFLLKLQPAVPLMASFVNKLSQITDVTIPDVDLQWAPLPKLLMRRSSANGREETIDEQDDVFTVVSVFNTRFISSYKLYDMMGISTFSVQPLPGGVMHGYILPGAAWEVPAQRAALVDSIPFTHPAHVPALLELLRHQCAINTLLTSCMTSERSRTGSVCDAHFEVLPESDTSFSVTFQRPDTDSLAVLLVDVSDSRRINCILFGAGTEDRTWDEHLSAVIMRCTSLPVTLRTIHSKLEEISAAPRSPRCPATTEAENDHLSPPSSNAVTDNSSALTTFSQSASAPEGDLSVSGSASYAMSVAKSELLPEINTSPAVNLYPFTPVGVFPRWMTSNGQLSELM
ncbi:Mediator of RNA polymerase II transcription subunit 1 [Nibea albiflora]|uniref:Mediator of RNA polymerase II transcription subunit 1 n=1 Tax=Nibea albiflora TaxID=240163 RepID=A0ACB7F6D6_NIBAL|nr:Mediator of RNA polymerase II transcription subunit 1 [Nibea albiflora]